jgi:hypothetical protein
VTIDEGTPRPAHPSAATEAPAQGGVPREVWVVAAAVVIGLGMALLDTTIVNVALDAIAGDMHATLGTIQWVSTAYLLTP